MELMEIVGNKILEFYDLTGTFKQVGEQFHEYAGLAVATAGFTPIPYKVFTIAAGAFKVNFVVFVVASIIGRSGRFVLVSALIYIFGPAIKGFIDKYFNLMVIIFTILLIVGFLIIKLLL